MANQPKGDVLSTVKAQKIDTPVSPLVTLIRRYMIKCGISRRALGRKLAAEHNPSKTFRRLDQLLRGERFIPEFSWRVAKSLQVPPGELALALEAHYAWERGRRVACNRRAVEEVVKRRGPHLWGRLPEGHLPSLITVIGAEFFLLVRLPEELADLPYYQEMREVGKQVRAHYLNDKRCPLVGYDYRRSIHEVYRFDTEGDYIGRVDGDPLGSKTFVRIGRRKLETPCKLFSPKTGGMH